MADEYVEGVVADGEELWLTSSTGTLTKVMGLKSIKEPSFMVEEQEDTDMGSGGVKQYLPGLGDWTTFQATLKHRPGSATHLLIEEHLMSKERRPMKVVLRGANDGSTVEGTGEIILLGYDKPSRNVGTVNDATITGRVRRYDEGDLTSPAAA
ncbi:hypothetical protein [Novosphingopyxis sp. YJ-S2-01]|uniref:hypothetical protein n=1 Tax=Novosphingopyxis sp. YJ-S2-01 TaxID=2794021 RepID=UPI0018DC07B1|nr:hypothetical protein [Novosphingopyxis sp. YJ-S2-01]MBH9537526.1 hypothetical protein [Novosphingopyxis sp. YJ-S2-01]